MIRRIWNLEKLEEQISGPKRHVGVCQGQGYATIKTQMELQQCPHFDKLSSSSLPTLWTSMSGVWNQFCRYRTLVYALVPCSSSKCQGKMLPTTPAPTKISDIEEKK